jgi:hypothetical protein
MTVVDVVGKQIADDIQRVALDEENGKMGEPTRRGHS